MGENPSFIPDFIPSPELEEGIKNDSITTFTITVENLRYYEEAARSTNFEVRVIAGPGQYYITKQAIAPITRSSAMRRRPSTNRQDNKTPTITAVKSQLPVREGYVAISLKRPEGVLYDTAFNLARQQAEQRRLNQRNKSDS